MKLCNEKLYENGKVKAVCTMPYGTEHSHHDTTASQAIKNGTAKGA